MPMVSEHLCFTRSCIAIFSSNAQHFDLCAVKGGCYSGYQLQSRPLPFPDNVTFICIGVLEQLNSGVTSFRSALDLVCWIEALSGTHFGCDIQHDCVCCCARTNGALQ